MEQLGQGTDAVKTGQEILGYLNFSSGAADPRFLQNINHLFEVIDVSPERVEPTWKAMHRFLAKTLQDLHGRGEAFRQIDQAEAVLGLVFEKTLPGYRQFHADLLFHQSEESPVPAAVHRPGLRSRARSRAGRGRKPIALSGGAIAQLNDYLGHRPVAVLRTQQKIQPYAHEWVRPIPLFIRGAGVAVGRYHDLVTRALAILEGTDSSLQFDSMFDPALLEELAVDPRAYDFDHPVNKRPNYLFGQWDLGKLDNAGRCRRFVLQQVSLDAMMERIEHRGSLPYEEMLFEAAAVLAGTVLMGSRISGNRPEAHDSSVTLSSLVQQIAVYRDTFYERLLAQMQGPHAERLRAEAVAVRQPFGGVRQHFNQHLARRRAEQLQHVHLAELFARMGYTEAAQRQARVVPVASARLKCDIHCRLTTAHLAIEEVHSAAGGAGQRSGPAARGRAPAARLEHAARLLEESIGLLHRAIECGALVDPWNILGFGGQYSLFPSPENSVYDHRIDELIGLVGSIFTVGVQIQKEAAAVGITALENQVSAAVGCPGRLVGQVRHDRGRLGGELLRPRDPRVGRPRGSGPAGLARGGGGLGRPGLLARAGRAVPLAQGLRPGGRCPAGAAESRGLDGPVGPVAQPGRTDSAGRRRLFLPQPGAGLDAGPVGRLRRRRSRRPPDAAAALGPGPQVPRLPGGQRRGELGGSALRVGGRRIGRQRGGGEEVDDIYGAASKARPFAAARSDIEGEMSKAATPAASPPTSSSWKRPNGSWGG